MNFKSTTLLIFLMSILFSFDLSGQTVTGLVVDATDRVPIPGVTITVKNTTDGTVTAANASTINDGASALVLMSESKMKELNLSPIARIVSYADAEQEPKKYTTTPVIAAPLAAKRAGLKIN